MNTIFFTLLLFGIDDAIIVPALIAAFTSLAGTTASTISSRRNQNKQIQAQKELNEQNHQYFLENREYNEPANQMQRLMDAGISPFGQSFGNSSASAFSAQPVGTTDDIFGNIAQGFANATKTGMDTYLARKQQKINNELAEEKLKIQEQQLDEIKKWHSELNKISAAKIDLGYFSAKNSFDLGLRGLNERRQDRLWKYGWLNNFYTDTRYLGAVQRDNIINQIAWRDKVNPVTIAHMQLMNDYQSLYNNYIPTIFHNNITQSNDKTIVNHIARNLAELAYPYQAKQTIYQGKWGRHVQNIRENIGMLRDLNNLLNETIETGMDLMPTGKYGLKFRNYKDRNLTDF